MWPEIVVIVGPLGDGAAGVIEAKEQAFVEQFVAHPTVEGFNIAVLHRLSWRDIVPLNLVILRPGQDGIRGEFRAVIGDNHSWLAASFDQCRQLPCDTAAGDCGVRDCCQAFPRHIINVTARLLPPVEARSRDVRHVFSDVVNDVS